jgi:A/G-specific adenine glycosylase
VHTLCQAHQRGEVDRFPIKTRTLKRTSQSWWWLLATNPQGEVLLVQRPSRGIWAGLFCLPMWEDEATLLSQLPALATRQAICLPAQLHVLTHRDLHLHTTVVKLGARQSDALARQIPGVWHSAEQWTALGLPAPVRSLLTQTLSHPTRGVGAR